ncbi:Lrp/AsnC family transcriptional regulator [Candidatus Woesearchaeota archaeon]|nr:Lrp/AsnC family transcriptional regulator [Candidatus Woesearchaeota archaeon]
MVKIDQKDKKVLEQLQINARQSVSKIARKTKLPIDVVKYRIKKLEKEGIIKSYHAFLDPLKLGYPLYAYVVFSLSNLKPEQEKHLIGYLKLHKRIVYVSKNSGRWDIVIGVCAKDYKDLDEVVKQIRAKCTDSIKDFEVIPVIEEFKYDYMADLIEV